MEENGSGKESQQEEHNEEALTRVTGMYKDWFLDYASYVILERAVPAIEDGFKPVQRRIMHALKELDDGRYNKVANVVGHTMQYHPHGDASIADAMVQLGQKDLLIDTQGNWGNILTGDGAAAPLEPPAAEVRAKRENGAEAAPDPTPDPAPQDAPAPAAAAEPQAESPRTGTDAT